VSVDVLVDEATQAGFVDWLAAQLREQGGPDGIPLDGPGGLVPALTPPSALISSPTGFDELIKLVYGEFVMISGRCSIRLRYQRTHSSSTRPRRSERMLAKRVLNMRSYRSISARIRTGASRPYSATNAL
jgi:hypothetical protein